MLDLAGWKQFVRDDRGQDLVEYVLIIVFIALAIVAALSAYRETLRGVFNESAATVQNQSTL